jgi:hypothetical protein
MATLEQTAKVLGGLSILYPRFTLTPETIAGYHRILGDVPFHLLDKAALHIGANNTFFPAAAELRKAAFGLAERANGVPSAQDAWAEVCKSFGSHGYYRGAPEWSHELIGKAIDGIGGYAALCVSENAVADRARFVESYKSYLGRHRDDVAMLPEVRDVVRQLAETLRPVMKLREGM